MQVSAPPTLIPLPWANSGTKNTIPTASQVGIVDGKASLTTGFPPLTFTPLAAGGVAPDGADFNGILNLITQFLQWQSAGGATQYDATFSAAVGGYPAGATVRYTDGKLWRSLVDSNTVVPTSGANWANSDDLLTSSALFANSKATSGYQKLPGGLILQWGQISQSDTGVALLYNFTLPVAFPVAALQGFITVGSQVNAGAVYCSVEGLTTTKINGFTTGPTNTRIYRIFTVGY